jgi:tetratricopeptide (TPR) repeat protein
LVRRMPKHDASGPDGSARGKPVGWRKWAFRLAAVVIVPALLLGLLEMSLRLLGYGYPSHFFVKLAGQDACASNERFAWRFFPPSIAREPDVSFSFPARKPAGTYRIFVLGSSAAMGDPVIAFGFGRILGVMLKEQYPQWQFEVINTAMTAINSHVVREIAKDCARHDGDLFIVYMGNNEVIGPFGPGTVFGGRSLGLMPIRASIWARSMKVGELLNDLSRQLAEERVEDWKGLEMFLENRVPAEDPRLRVMQGHFQENLADISAIARKSGAKVILCTVASNLKDCAPFASMHKPDLSPAMKGAWEQLYAAGTAFESAGDCAKAVEQYLQAARIDGGFADLQFRLGRCDLALGRFGEAHDRYVRARDMDALRFRADSAINRVIGEVAEGKEAQGIYLVDAESVFQEEAPHKIPGRELFWDHVHMNFDGNYLLAQAVFRKVADILPDSMRKHISGEVSPPSKERCAEALTLTGWDVYGMVKGYVTSMKKPPFTLQLDHVERYALLLQDLESFKKYMSPEALQETSETYRKAVQSAPGDLLLRLRFADLLCDRGDPASAVEQYLICLREAPHPANIHGELAKTLMAQGKLKDALDHCREALRFKPDFANPHYNLANVLVARGALEDALAQYREALRLKPGFGAAHYSLGNALAAQGKIEEAITQYREALRFEFDPAVTHFNLANILVRQGMIEEAVLHYGEALRLDPDLRDAHINLAHVLVAQRRTEEAVTHFRAALRLGPDSAEIHLNLADVLAHEGKWDDAVAHYREALRLKPDVAAAHCQLARTLCAQGRTEDAISALGQALRLCAGAPEVANALAWIRATDANSKFRDGAEAVTLAEQAVQRSGGMNPQFLDTLAAAYAEEGRFQEAVSVGTRAFELAVGAGKNGIAAEIENRLTLYRAGKAVRQNSGGVQR